MTDPRDRIQTALGNSYSLARELGAGGMATVYLAHDVKHDRDVAIKVLRQDVAESLARERFLREIHVAARLNHPNILPLYDSGEADGLLYFVMPVMLGQTVQDRLQSTGRLSVDEAVRIGTQVADALDYAHRNDVVHRDIKPGNILLHEGHAIVADFGIGKALVAAAAESPTFTQVGMSVGTPAYMSPEQAAGDILDGRSDLFALGCTMYEMLTGEQAFTGPTLQAVIAKRFSYVPPAVTQSRSTVPPSVSRTVERLLAAAPDARFMSGAEVVRALRGEIDVQSVRRELPSIAVLPFANMSANPDNAFFSDGISDDITVALTKVTGLKVAARASAFSFAGKNTSLAEIGDKLNVGNVLEGSVRRAGNRVRVTAQLMETKTGTQRWGDQYDRDLNDIFAIQDEISHSIVSELEVVLGVRANAPLVVRPTDDMEAYDLYLRAREAIRVRTPSSLLRGRELCSSAIQRDPSFARAWLVLAEAFAATGVYGYEPLAYCREQAEKALAQAARLHGVDADVALYRGFIKLYLRADWPAAGADFAIALAANPNDVFANSLLAGWHGLLGNRTARTAAATKAVTIDPLSPFTFSLAAHSYYYTADYEDALAYQERALALDANFLNALRGSALCLSRLGEPDEAVTRMRRQVAISEQSPTSVAMLAYMLQRVGETAEATTLADRLWAEYPEHAYSHLIAEILRGDEERLTRALVDAVTNGVGGAIAPATTVKPDLDELVTHHRFGPLVRQLDLYAQMPGLPPLAPQR